MNPNEGLGPWPGPAIFPPAPGFPGHNRNQKMNFTLQMTWAPPPAARE